MTTRSELLVLLRRQPGSTVKQLAGELHLSGVAVRRHLDDLVRAGMVRAAGVSHDSGSSRGRPATGWALTESGRAALPERYDRFALQLLDDVTEVLGADVLQQVLARRVDKVAADYRAHIDDDAPLGDRVEWLARQRDAEGYLAVHRPDGDAHCLVEHHCAVRHAAERHPSICAMELALLQRSLGPAVTVVREQHALSGDPCCCYRISD